MQMTVPQSTIDAIRSRRTQLRAIERPVKRGSFGERKRAPVTRGAVLVLRPVSEYETWRQVSANEPTRARAVLWLIARCERPVLTIKVTVTDVRHDAERGLWVIEFALGEHAVRDPTRFPAVGGPPPAICHCGRAFGREFPDEPERCRAGHVRPRSDEDADRGYSGSVGRAVDGIGPEVSPERQKHLSTAARRAHESGTVARRDTILEKVSELRLELRGENGTAKERDRLRSIERQLRLLERERIGARRAAA